MTATFTHDWTVTPSAEWPAMFAEHGITSDKPHRFLEIGCFEGRTTLWLLENILSDPGSSITVIDTFGGDFDHVSQPDYPQRFLANIEPHRHKVIVKEGRSAEVIPTLRGTFDFVYVDGSHLEDDVWSDATLSWPLLRDGGVMVFDDYERGQGDGHPKAAVTRFVREHPDARIVNESSQCTVVKT